MNQLDNILHQVGKPARYTGGEWQSVIKDWEKTAIKFVLSYPDLYDIGMSNMAVPDFVRNSEQSAGCSGRAGLRSLERYGKRHASRRLAACILWKPNILSKNSISSVSLWAMNYVLPTC